MLVLDTDVLIDVQRGHASAVTWFSGLIEIPAVPGLVVMELIQGAHDSRQVRDALALTAPFPIIWPTAVDCHRALAEFTALHLTHSLGLLDALIAACVVGLSAELCTFNDKHYRVVPDLKTIQPYRR